MPRLTAPQPTGPHPEYDLRWRTPLATTEAMAALFETTEPLLDALKSVVDQRAVRHADRPVPASTLAEAQAVLAAARRIFSRHPLTPRLLQLGRATDWGGLASKLAVAAAAFAAFEARFRQWDAEAGEHFWLTREGADAAHARPQSALPDSDLDEIEQDLSTLF